jgi:membrane protein DedA with SNARE-associated domain
VRWLVLLLVLAGILALVGTLTKSAVAGWAGLAALLGAFVAYLAWRRSVRQRRSELSAE